jgi:DNA transformation protein and related proteins
MSRREFLDFVLEQMSQLRGLRSRSMFGGFGIYQGDLFFALIADDRLYLKTDSISKPDFVAHGLGPFVYGNPGKTGTMQYFEVPPEVYEDLDSMRIWAEKGIAAAKRAVVAPHARKRRKKANKNP